MKAGTESKLKFMGLKRQLRLPFWQVVGILEAIWHTTLRNAPDGDIGRLSNEEIAAAIEWDGDADELIAALVKSRWLDTDVDFRLIVHDWSEHCPNYLRGGYQNGKKKFADIVARERPPEPTVPKNDGAKLPSLDTNLATDLRPPSKATSSEGVATNSIQSKSIQGNSSQGICDEAALRPSPPKPPPFDPSSVSFPIFPCVLGKKNGPQTWELTAEHIEQLAKIFPGVDVQTEVLAAHEWIMSNLPKRKTADGMRDYLFGWMKREQNKGGSRPRSQAKPPESIDGI